MFNLKFSVDSANEQSLIKKSRQNSKRSSVVQIPSQQAQKQRNQLTLFQESNISGNPIKNFAFQQKKKWENVQQQLQVILKPFKQSISNLLENINDQNKYYRLLSFMRQNELLSDVAETINEKIFKQNLTLKKQVQTLKQTIAYLSKNQRQTDNKSKSKDYQTPNLRESSGIKIDSTRSLPQNIYVQAKIMKQKDFVEWCQKILMKDKIIITQLRRQAAPNRSLSKTQQKMSFHRKSFSEIYDKEVQKDNPVSYQKYSSLIRKIQSLSPLLEAKLFQCTKMEMVQQVQNLKVQTFTCKNFCCSLQKQNLQPLSCTNISFRSENKGQKAKSERDVYRDNKMTEYFKRYYKHPDFKVNSIKSVEQTRGEEMTRLENAYLRKLQSRNKQRYNY